MSLTRDELRDELLAITGARRELSRADEQYLIEGFLDKLDVEIDSRIQKNLGRLNPVGLRPATRTNHTTIAVMAFIMAVPLSLIAVFAHWQGLIVAWVAILLVVYLTTRD